MSDTNSLTLDSPELSLADYRTLRSGGEVPKVENTSAADAVQPDAGTAAAREEADVIEESKQDKAGGKKDGLQFRFSELTQQIKDLKTQLAAGKPAATPPTEPKVEPATPAAPAADPADPEPDPSKFSDYVEWQKQWIRWNGRQERRAEQATQTKQQQAAKAAEQSAAWAAKVSEAAKAKPDFESVALNKDLSVSAVMGTAITESDIGTEILYHLGQHPDEAARISQLSPVRQVAEIGKLEAKLAAVADGEDPPTKEPVVSKAPAPAKPVGGASGSRSIPKTFDEGSMSQAEFRALRESGKLR